MDNFSYTPLLPNNERDRYYLCSQCNRVLHITLGALCVVLIFITMYLLIREPKSQPQTLVSNSYVDSSMMSLVIHINKDNYEQSMIDCVQNYLSDKDKSSVMILTRETINHQLFNKLNLVTVYFNNDINNIVYHNAVDIIYYVSEADMYTIMQQYRNCNVNLNENFTSFLVITNTLGWICYSAELPCSIN